MVGDNLITKIADFGEAKEAPSRNRLLSCVGTEGFVAPEIIRGESYTNKVDSYSFAYKTPLKYPFLTLF